MKDSTIIDLTDFISNSNLSSILNSVAQNVYLAKGIRLVTAGQFDGSYRQYYTTEAGELKKDTCIIYKQRDKDLVIAAYSGGAHWSTSLDNFYLSTHIEVVTNQSASSQISTDFISLLIKTKKISDMVVMPTDPSCGFKRVEGFSISETHECVELMFNDKTMRRMLMPKSVHANLDIGDYVEYTDAGMVIYDCRHIN